MVSLKHKALTVVSFYFQIVDLTTLNNWNNKAKLRLGRKWADLAGAIYRYYMVFDENDTGFDGAYRLSEFLELLKRL